MAEAAALGPRWSPKELRTFYILLKAHGEQWAKLEELLPQRSAAMMRALVDLHREYLALPEASAEGFCAVMTDHYKTLEERAAQGGQASANEVEQSPDSATGLRKRDAQTPKIMKKRRLDRLLSMEIDSSELLERQTREQLRIRAESDVEMLEQRSGSPRTKSRRSTLSPKKARWHLHDASFDMMRGPRFDLPWYCWFSACDDADYFLHNEFIDCLNQMGLTKMHLAARPIWSSVRSSMGHPRRLSPCFFEQEKRKLEEFRKLRRSPRQDQTGAHSSLPQVSPLKLDAGAKVVVWMEMHRRFLVATIVSVSASEGVCSATTKTQGENGEPVETRLLCPLNAVMALDFLQSDKKAKRAAPKRTASLLRRSNSKKQRGRQTRSANELPTSNVDMANVTQPLLESGVFDFRTNRLQAMIAVKDLLQRKEKLVNAVNRLNNIAAEVRRNVSHPKASSKINKGKKLAARGDPSGNHTFQQQHGWLVESLEDTNAALKSALLRLNSFIAPPETTLPGEAILSAKEMRWALDFLKGSQQRAATMVDQQLSSSYPSSVEILPQTKEVIASSLCLMSVFTAADTLGYASSIPPAVLQKLVARMVELLKPNHEENMDLYAELKTAAEGLQAKFAVQDNTTP